MILMQVNLEGDESMNELISTFNSEQGDILISGRELHEFLEVGTPYKKWFDRMIEYGFTEKNDFIVTDIFVPNSNGGKQNQIDHHIKLDMAKEIAMIQRTDKGKQARQYFLDLERRWNSPDMIITVSALILDISNYKGKKNNIVCIFERIKGREPIKIGSLPGSYHALLLIFFL